MPELFFKKMEGELLPVFVLVLKWDITAKVVEIISNNNLAFRTSKNSDIIRYASKLQGNMPLHIGGTL